MVGPGRAASRRSSRQPAGLRRAGPRAGGARAVRRSRGPAAAGALPLGQALHVGGRAVRAGWGLVAGTESLAAGEVAVGGLRGFVGSMVGPLAAAPLVVKLATATAAVALSVRVAQVLLDLDGAGKKKEDPRREGAGGPGPGAAAPPAPAAVSPGMETVFAARVGETRAGRALEELKPTFLEDPVKWATWGKEQLVWLAVTTFFMSGLAAIMAFGAWYEYIP